MLAAIGWFSTRTSLARGPGSDLVDPYSALGCVHRYVVGDVLGIVADDGEGQIVGEVGGFEGVAGRASACQAQLQAADAFRNRPALSRSRGAGPVRTDAEELLRQELRRVGGAVRDQVPFAEALDLADQGVEVVMRSPPARSGCGPCR